MSDKKEIIVDCVTYVPKISNGDIKIVVLQRGWNAIGRFERNGSDCTLKDSYVIRVWGTERGLGQLALEGKQKNTKLDKAGTMSFDYLTVVILMDCDQEKWKNVL
jgi:hypothetical protein